MKRLVCLAVMASLVLAPQSALAWGSTGHRMVGEGAIRALPEDIPAFLRTAQAASDVGELSREPDRTKGSGRIHDHDRDAAHFVDLDEAGKLLGGPSFLPLPSTRAAYETALRAHNLNSWDAGYLQYSIIDRWQQLTTDFGFWRVLVAAEANPAWAEHRAWFTADRVRREALILKDIGELSHFVGDGSQPLHVSIHYNGWGDYPNPKGYSTARLHGPFEGDLVLDQVKAEAVEAQVAALKLCGCAPEQRVADYILANAALVEPFYQMEKAGGMAPGDPRGAAFATRQLAAGASELRDVIVEAWRHSAGVSVGWRPVPVADVVSGKTNPYRNLYGTD